MLKKLAGLFSKEKAVAVIPAAVRAPPLPSTPVPHSALDLYFDKDLCIGWTAFPVNRSDNYWQDFLKWYHCRPQSSCYVMDHKYGSQMVRRKDIRRYEIRYWESYTTVRG